MMPLRDTEAIFVLAFVLAVIAGIARQLSVRRRRERITDVMIGGLYAGVLGLGVALVWYDYYPDRPRTLLGLVILGALAGATSVDELLAWMRATIKAVEIASRDRAKTLDGEPKGKRDERQD